MKKLIALVMITALLLCGCSLFGQAEESGNLSEKLSELEYAEQRATDRANEAGPEAEPLPERLSFEQIDPYDMLHNGWTLTQEKARDEFGMEPYADIDDYMHIEDLAQLLPGMSYGNVVGMWSYTSNGAQPDAVGEYEYRYRFDYAISTEDAVQVFRLVFEATDEYFGGRNKSWGHEKFENFESLGNLEFADLLFNDEDNNASDATSCSWGFYVDGNPGIFTIILRAYEERIDELEIYIDFGTGRTQSSNYFPDDAAESSAFESVLPSEPSAPTEESKAADSASGSSSGPGSSAGSGGVSFIGFVLDQEDAWYEEGLVQLVDYGATPNGSGGYDCYVTIYNGTPDMTKIAIEVWLYGGYEEADIFMLAEPAAFYAGDSSTFYFDISYPSASGNWEVLIKYWFW